jgi:hypothetical protein
VSEAETIQDNTLYTFKECQNLLLELFERITFDQIMITFQGWDLTALMVPPQSEDVVGLRCLKNCPITNRIHYFDRDRRCVGCDEQLCPVSRVVPISYQAFLLIKSQECQNCIINSSICKTISKCNTGICSSDHRNSIAVRRIHSPCNADHWNTVPAHYRLLRRTAFCTCTEFLMEHTHSCEKGNGHFCRTCLETTLSTLQVPNTRKVTMESPHGVREILIVSKAFSFIWL